MRLGLFVLVIVVFSVLKNVSSTEKTGLITSLLK